MIETAVSDEPLPEGHTTKSQVEIEGRKDMTNTGKKSLEEVSVKVEAALAEKYEKIEFKGSEIENWFKINDNHFVRVDKMMGDNYDCLLLEHAESLKQRYLAEDGDLFYPGDFESEEKLIEAMLKEASEE